MTRARNFADVISGNFAIPSGSLGNAVPADGSITTAKLADDAITSAKIADDAVVAAAIADNAIVSAAIANDAITAAKIADGAVSKGFSNLTHYSANSASNTIPANADKLLFIIAGAGGGGAASFMAGGGNGGDSTVVYNSVTYTASGGVGADPTDGSTNSFDVAPAHSGGSGTGGLAILGGGSMGGGSGQTIYGNYSSTPIDGRNG